MTVFIDSNIPMYVAAAAILIKNPHAASCDGCGTEEWTPAAARKCCRKSCIDILLSIVSISRARSMTSLSKFARLFCL